MNVVQNNLISIVILVILFIGVSKQVNRRDVVFRSFLILLGIDAVMLFLEIIVYLCIGASSQSAHLLMSIVTVTYHMLIPIVLLLTFIYIDYHFYSKLHKPLRYMIPFAILFIVNAILVISSLSNNTIFMISSNNDYDVGTYYVYYELSVYAIFFMLFLYTVIQRKKIARSDLLPLTLFIIPLTVNYLLTAFAEFIYSTWNAYMISLLIIYIFIQLQITSTDYLTGLQNRRGYEYLLFNLNKYKTHNEKIIGIMIDIDNFKSINDEYGHMIGDEALKAIGNILKHAVRKNDFVSRTGGDEFAIVIQSNEPNVGDIVVDRIRKELNLFNKEMPFGFKIFISIGFDEYRADKHHSISSFFEFLDHEMYRDKRDNEHATT